MDSNYRNDYVWDLQHYHVGINGLRYSEYPPGEKQGKRKGERERIFGSILFLVKKKEDEGPFELPYEVGNEKNEMFGIIDDTIIYPK